MENRFSRIATDPRFKQIKRDATKVVLDPRFEQVLADDGDFGLSAAVDKYGRVVHASGVDELKRYYRLDVAAELPVLDDAERYKLARGEGLLESSDDEGSPVEEAPVDEPAPEDVPLGDESARFAVVNLDFDHVKASDLFKVFEGFAPKNGSVLGVRVYPSDFGLERMAHEASHGPPKAIFGSASASTDAFDNRQLRKYQLERLRYYFAVVTCDSAHTAKLIYAACDGAEFETTANFFDMRFVPDDMVFDNDVVDEASEAPTVYVPVDFATKALQHSKVELTWDNDDPQRAKVTRRKFTKDEIGKMDFQAYLASSESDSNDDVDVYKNLLLGSHTDEVQGDMEVTFTQGLAEKAQQLIDKKNLEAIIANETPFEGQIRKQKEKRNARKTPVQDDDDEHTGSELSSEEDIETQQDRIEMSKEHLALLIDEDSTPHFDARDILKKKSVQAGFDINTNDVRFTDVYSSHHFAIDPTHPSFKKTDNMQKILKEKLLQNDTLQNETTEKSELPINQNAKYEIKSLVESVITNLSFSKYKGEEKIEYCASIQKGKKEA